MASNPHWMPTDKILTLSSLRSFETPSLVLGLNPHSRHPCVRAWPGKEIRLTTPDIEGPIPAQSWTNETHQCTINPETWGAMIRHPPIVRLLFTMTEDMANQDTLDNSTQPPPSASYPAIPPPQSGSRLRSSTLNVDPRDHHYRTTGSDAQTQSPLSQARSTPTSTSYSASSYTTSYPSAPLTAPMEYSVPRSSDPKTHLQEPQMSAPIAPPSDFSQALHGNMGNQDQGRNESHGHGMGGREGHKRKRSLTLPTGATRPLF
jgi:hypothetical protein